MMISSGIPVPRWNVPYKRNPFFTGREEILRQLHRALHTENAVYLSHPQGISGLGGIGKTQTALEYAYRYAADYEVVLWVRADALASLNASFVELAHLLELSERNEQEQQRIVEAVLRWLREKSEWLLIFDNIDDLSLAEPFLPKGGRGHVVFTTRAHSLGGIAQALEVPQMEAETGALLLLRRASLIPLKAKLTLATRDKRELASQISEELDGLPLALDQAGAYIKETPCTLTEYLGRYRTRRQDLLEKRGSLEQNYPASVATTWSLSFEKVSQADQAAGELLNFCAFLAPDAIPEEMLTKGVPHLGPVLSPVIGKPIQLDQVCKEILRYSLMQRGGDEGTLSMHRLVQVVLQSNLTPPMRTVWKQRAVSAVNVARPMVEDVAQWDACERWVPHALVSATWIEEEQFYNQDSLWLLDWAGSYLDKRARYAEAEPLLQHALIICERLEGADDPATAIHLNNLGGLYQHQGRSGEAERVFKRALAIFEQQLGADNPFCALVSNNLATLYQAQGEYGKAESLYLQAKDLSEEYLRDIPHQKYIASILTNLTTLYDRQGRSSEAELLGTHALSIFEQQSGGNHPDTIMSLNNLAELSHTQGKYAEAESLYQKALALNEQILGPDHPHTALSLNNLATLYRDQGKYDQAEPLYRRALAIRERQLGAKHHDTAGSLNNLAQLYVLQGKYRDAEPLLQRALAIFEQSSHLDTATSLNNLAVLYCGQGKYEEAESLLQRALATTKQQLGAMHPDVARGLNNLAVLHQTQERYAEAEPLYQRALAIYEQQLGTNHPDTQSIRRNLEELYRLQRIDKQRRRLNP